jgi:hypothetical protein
MDLARKAELLHGGQQLQCGLASRRVGVEGDALLHLGDIEKVKFVMKGGRVVRDDTRGPR